MDCEIELDDRFMVAIDYSFGALSEVIRFESYFTIAPGDGSVNEAVKFHYRVYLGLGKVSSENLSLLIKRFLLRIVRE